MVWWFLAGFLTTAFGFIVGALLARMKYKDQAPRERWAQGFASGQVYALKEAEDAMWAYSMRLRESQAHIPRPQEWFLGFEMCCAKMSEYVEKVTTEDDTSEVAVPTTTD